MGDMKNIINLQAQKIAEQEKVLREQAQQFAMQLEEQKASLLVC